MSTENSVTHGLTDREAATRRARGQGHTAEVSTGRTYWEIARANLFTFFNITLVVLGAILISMGLWRDAIVASGLALLNAMVGAYQEMRAKQRLDRIALANRLPARVVRGGIERDIDPEEIVLGDLLLIGSGDLVHVDGEVVSSQSLECDESLLTGESDPVEKVTGGVVFSGSFVVSGSGRYLVTKVGADNLANTLAAGAKAHKSELTPLQQSVNLMIRLLLVIGGLYLLMVLVGSVIWNYTPEDTVIFSAVVIGIVPTGLFLMITITYTMAIVRLAKQDALIQQTNAVESLSNIDVFCMDKTGTLTSNNLVLEHVIPLSESPVPLDQLLGIFAASVSVSNKTRDALASAYPAERIASVEEVPFSSARKWSALSFADSVATGSFVLGAPEIIIRGSEWTDELQAPADWTEAGLRVLLFARTECVVALRDESGEPRIPLQLNPLAWLAFRDELRPNCRETIDGFRAVGIELKIISGDNSATVAALAFQAGFPHDAELVSGLDLEELDDATFSETVERTTVFGRITPQQKERIIEVLRERGHYVAMTGDGVNDVLSLKRANLGIAMQSGSQATRAVADIVLLGDSFGVLPFAFAEGQRIRRGLQGILSLFLTRAFVVALLIMASAVVQANIPFTPSHLAILTTLTVGFPTFSLALFAHAGRPPERFVRSLVAFVLPAVLLMSLFGFGTYVGLFFWHDVDLPSLRAGGIAANVQLATEDRIARDSLTLFLVLCGLWLVPFVSPPSRWWAVIEESTEDWRPTIVAVFMVPLYALIVAIAPVREFLEVNALGFWQYAMVTVVSLVWAMVLRACWQHKVFERTFGY